MNTQKLDRAVVDFVMKVRDLLDDLDEETRTDLVEGLEADLGELVAEQGSAGLPAPEQYAEELRAAAGLPARRGTALLRDRVRRRQQRRDLPVGERFDALCDRWRSRFLVQARHPGVEPAWGLAQAVRPVWWVLRGYLLVQAADVLTGNWESLDPVPALGVPLLGPALVVLAVVLSVQVGRGVAWPGHRERNRVAARAALLALNVGALVSSIPVVDALDRIGPDLISYRDATMYVDQSGLRLRGQRICNIQPYDAQGRPLEGVQLFDQDGDRITTSCSTWDEGSHAQHYPWQDAAGQERWNVFPQPERAKDRRVKEGAWDSDSPAQLPQPDSLRVPPVTLPVLEEGMEEGMEEESSGDAEAGRRDSTRPGEARRGDRTEGAARR
jgi:hypothetical protein